MSYSAMVNIDSNMVTCDNTLDTLQVLLDQERKYYRIVDYFPHQVKTVKGLQDQYPTQKFDTIDLTCRTKMIAWYEQICSFCQYDNADTTIILENAVNYLDRYIVTSKGSIALLDRNYYQCTAITCLYIAMKVHASSAISASDMSQITRNAYTTEQIEDMECHILKELEWRVNPPTASIFVSEFVKALIESIQLHVDEASTIMLITSVNDLIRKQTSSAISNEKFVTIPSSIIAYSSLFNALRLVLLPTHDSLQALLQKMNNMESSLFGCGMETTIEMVQTIMYESLTYNNHITEPFYPKVSKFGLQHEKISSPTSSSPTTTTNTILAISM
jgi:hypothetical protein